MSRMEHAPGIWLRFRNGYLYDGQGNLVRRHQTTPSHPGAGDQKVTYAGGIYEEESSFCGAPYIVTKHYNAFGRVTAQRRGATLSYLLADHLSSTVGAVSASTGSVTQRARPAPVHVSVCVGRERTRGP